MKKLPIVLLALAVSPVHAQSLLGTLTKYQSTLETPTTSAASTSSGGSASRPVSEVKPSTISSSSSSAKCEENDQTSLPLAYVSSLITERDGKLDFVHDARQGTLTVSAPEMIGNCSNMLEWKLRQPEIQGAKAYAVEVKIKEGENCSEAGCTYKVAKVKDGVFQSHEEVVLKPTLKGFEECLQKSGVIENGKVVPGNIYGTQVSEKFSSLDKSGKLLFVSHGPASALVKAKYGKFEPVDRCDYYEKAHPEVSQLLTYEDQEKERLDAEAAKLKECKINEYHKVADFIEKYEGYASELIDVRDKLILESAKKAAENLTSGKYTEEDLKVLADFEKYIVQPKIDLARALYDEMIELEGDAKKQKQDQLRAVLAEIKALNQKPYFLAAHTEKLIKDGRFEEAEQLNFIKLTLQNHERLGQKIQGQEITPSVALANIQAERRAFADRMVEEKEFYEIRTGQTSGQSEFYTRLAKRMVENIQVRTQNYNAEIQSEYMRVQQPNGHCFKYWVNTKNCIQDTVDRIQELQAYLQHYNNVDKERAEEYEAKAAQYKALEDEGRAYLAKHEGGEAPEVETQRLPAEEDTTKPGARAAEAQTLPANMNQGMTFPFNFNMQGNAQAQAQMTPQMYQYPTSPYGQQNMFQQQNPYGYNLGQYAQYGQYGQQNYMGNQAYMNQFGMQPQYGNMGQGFLGGQASFNLGYGSQYGAQNMMYGNQMYGNQMYGNQNMMYQPYMNYNMMSMYGR